MILAKTIAAFAFTLFFLVCLFPLGVLAFLLGFLGLRKPMSVIDYKIAQYWSKGIIKMTGCTLTVEGLENIPSSGSVCFVSNHVGIFDIILALAFIGRPFGFIAKKELSMAPFFNLWILMLGGLFIDRKSIREALKTINQGIEKIRKGGSMLVFPEGTRSKGRGLLPFRSGAIRLATHSLATVVPIAIEGSYDVFERHYRVHAVPVRLVFCPPINPNDMSPEDRRHKLADEVYSIIKNTLENTKAPDPSQ